MSLVHAEVVCAVGRESDDILLGAIARTPPFGPFRRDRIIPASGRERITLEGMVANGDWGGEGRGDKKKKDGEESE